MKKRTRQQIRTRSDLTMDYQLQGRTAFISGGSRGIGRAAAELLCAEGVRVAIADLDPPLFKESSQTTATFIRADLTQADEIERVVQHVTAAFDDPPDFLVNNVGAASPAPFESLSEYGLQRCFQLNLMSHVRITRGLIGRIAERTG